MTTIYPSEVLAGGKSCAAWIKNLSRLELHELIQDKDIPLTLLPELVSNIPPKYLRNLIPHKKLQPELRVTILRRIYRASQNEINNESKIETFRFVSTQKRWTKRELQIAQSYILEVNKQSGVAVSKPKRKKAKKHKDSFAVRKEKQLVNFALSLVVKDADMSDISSFLTNSRTRLLRELQSTSSKFKDCETQASLLIEQASREFPSLSETAISRISTEELLAYQIEINQGLYVTSSALQFEDFIDSYKTQLRGPLASDFLKHWNTRLPPAESLYQLMIRAISTSEEDFESKQKSLELVSQRFDSHVLAMQPVLNYGQVNATSGGVATITFSASFNLEFTEMSFKYWHNSEDESHAFPVRFKVDFDRESKLNICSTTITSLKPGEVYFYAIHAMHNENRFNLEPREFKVPELPAPAPAPDYVYRDHHEYGAPVPFGGGGERRFNQLRP